MTKKATDQRLFAIYELMWRGVSVDEIFEATKIDRWFLHKIMRLLDCERELNLPN